MNLLNRVSLKGLNKFLAIIFLILFIFFTKAYSTDFKTKEIQEMLTFQGFSLGVADGISGKKTIRAIKNWQMLNYYDETGVLNNNQYKELKNQFAIRYKLDKKSYKFIEDKNNTRNNIVKKNINLKQKTNIENSNNLFKRIKKLSRSIALYIRTIF